MTITLPAELDRFLEFEVSAGRYASVSEAVCDAVRMMRRQRQVEMLRREIRIAEEQVARGEVVSLEDDAELREFMGFLRQERARELEAEGNGP